MRTLNWNSTSAATDDVSQVHKNTSTDKYIEKRLHCMSCPCTELLLFNYANINSISHSRAPLSLIVVICWSDGQGAQNPFSRSLFRYYIEIPPTSHQHNV